MSHCTNEIDCCTPGLFDYDSSVAEEALEESQEALGSPVSAFGSPICQSCEDGVSDCPDSPSDVLVAEFTYVPQSGSEPLAVAFTDTSQGSPTTWDWDFGDGSAHSTDQNPPIHNYTSNGSYTITLTISRDAQTEDVSHNVVVSDTQIGGPEPPGLIAISTPFQAGALLFVGDRTNTDFSLQLNVGPLTNGNITSSPSQQNIVAILYGTAFPAPPTVNYSPTNIGAAVISIINLADRFILYLSAGTITTGQYQFDITIS